VRYRHWGLKKQVSSRNLCQRKLGRKENKRIRRYVPCHCLH